MTDTHVPQGVGETRYWRSLDDLQQTPEFIEAMHREFPEGIAEHSGLTDEVSRRKFLGVVAASVALAGMTSCRKPGRQILPYTRRPEGLIPGVPRFYATAHDRLGYGIGALVRSNDGRPTKVEGNPQHPTSLGGTDPFMQAEILQLYDPARSKVVLHDGHAAKPAAAGDHGDHGGHGGHEGEAHGEPYTLADFRKAWGDEATQLAADEGAGIRFVIPPTTSPTLTRMLDGLRSALPKAGFVVWSPLHRDAEMTAAEAAFGRRVDTQYDFSQVEAVLAFDCDFLGVEQPSLAWTRTWAASRRIARPTDDDVSRLYVCESTHTVTGSNADHRFRMSCGEIGNAVVALARELGVSVPARGESPAWVAKVAKDLKARNGKACVLVGSSQPAPIQALGHAINAALGAVGEGKPVGYQPTPTYAAASLAALRQLVADVDAGKVKAIVCLGTNPVYDAPASLGFAAAYAKATLRVHAGLFVDETARASTWHVPLAHQLESWSDIVGWDGTATIVQPLIAPLYDAATPMVDLVAMLSESPDTEGYQLVQQTWRDSPVRGGRPFAEFWEQSLHNGVVDGSRPNPLGVQVDTARVVARVGELAASTAPSAGDLEVVFRPHPTIFDGRYANNPWMQELPTPIEKLTWDNAVLMSRGTAGQLGVYNGDIVELSVGDQKVEGGVWIQPGHAAFSITVHFGYGRELGADFQVAAGTGFDAFRIHDGNAFVRGATLRATGRKMLLATTQEHGVIEGRPLVRENTLEGFRAAPNFAEMMSPLAQAAALKVEDGKQKTERDLLKSLWKERDYSTGHQWAMVIDLSTCTGCSACVVACVAENNIPAVGKAQVLRGREMHWNRIDRYFGGMEAEATQDGVPLVDDPQVVHQMVPCMQCENAPCESVCPVAATVHSPEGLNDMVYNRCIGTRYCNNNCPYKVRRFNWFDFHGNVPAQKQLAFNPEVTIRHRGVMEKCTYCVQRINTGRIQSKLDGRKLADGDIKTACQEACPADAIVFGDMNDTTSRVAQLRGRYDIENDAVKVIVEGSPLNYAMLSELNVKPRTTYLAKIRNPNPELS